jgi:PncC family amidohydrolase
LLGHLIVAVPGSSAAFKAGLAPYSNAAKIALGVPRATLAAHGAVSRQVAEALAMAARQWAGADIGIAETGIAGPGGASESRPPGLFWIAVAHGDRVMARQFEFGLDRAGNQRAAAEAAIGMAIEALRG